MFPADLGGLTPAGGRGGRPTAARPSRGSGARVPALPQRRKDGLWRRVVGGPSLPRRHSAVPAATSNRPRTAGRCVVGPVMSRPCGGCPARVAHGARPAGAIVPDGTDPRRRSGDRLDSPCASGESPVHWGKVGRRADGIGRLRILHQVQPIGRMPVRHTFAVTVRELSSAGHWWGWCPHRVPACAASPPMSRDVRGRRSRPGSTFLFPPRSRSGTGRDRRRRRIGRGERSLRQSQEAAESFRTHAADDGGQVRRRRPELGGWPGFPSGSSAVSESATATVIGTAVGTWIAPTDDGEFVGNASGSSDMGRWLDSVGVRQVRNVPADEPIDLPSERAQTVGSSPGDQVRRVRCRPPGSGR